MVLALGGCCRAFDQPRHAPRPGDKDAEHFLRYFCHLVRRYGQNLDADFMPFETECSRDTTLDLETEGVRDQLNAVGFARFSNLFLETPAILSRAPMHIKKRTAIIMVAQMTLLRPIREGAPRMPHVMSMVFASGFGCVLAIFDSGPQEGMVPPGVIDFDGRRPRRPRCVELSWNDLAIITCLYAFTLPGFSRQSVCRLLPSLWWTSAPKRPTNCFASRSRTRSHCGRRSLWSAHQLPRPAHSSSLLRRQNRALYQRPARSHRRCLLHRRHLEHTRAQHLRAAVAYGRLPHQVCVPPRYGYAFDPDGSRVFLKPKSLVDRPHNLPVASLKCDQADILCMLEVTQVPNWRWHGNHNAFVSTAQTCSSSGALGHPGDPTMSSSSAPSSNAVLWPSMWRCPPAQCQVPQSC